MRIKRVACIGAGLIGSNLASLFCMNGLEVTLQDLNKEAIHKAAARIRKNCFFLARHGISKEHNPTTAIKRVKVANNIKEAVASADYVQESAFESYDVKERIFREVDKVAPESAIIATSSSGLLISKLQGATDSPDRCIVVHPFHPAHLVPLVELVRGKRTSVDTVNRTFKFMKSLGKVPIVLNREVPGYVANRLQVAVWREAIDLVYRNVASVEDVDKAMTAGLGLRWAFMGPHLTYHLAGGSKGMRGLVKYLIPNYTLWWRDMRTWTTIPQTAIRKVIKGIASTETVRTNTVNELEKWRDTKLALLLRTLHDDL